MSTAELIGDRAAIPGEAGPNLLEDSAQRALSLPFVLCAALLLLMLYAAFEHGAVAPPAEARVQVAVAALAAVAGAGWLGTGRLRLAAPRLAIAGAALLAAFAIWSGLTVFWSVAPNGTWLALDRAITYVIALCLGIAIGSSYRDAYRVIARGLFALALAVTVYALGQKLVPGLHVAGLFDLNQTGPLPRLQEPLGYWNALAVFIAMAVPLALALAADPSRGRTARLVSLCALELMLLTIALTYSRGGLLALALAIVVFVAWSTDRLRSVVWLAAAAVAAVPPLVLGLTDHALTAAGVSLGSREGAGAVLLVVLLASLGVLVMAGRSLLELEPALRIKPRRARGLKRLAIAAAATLLVAGAVVISLSSRGFTGTFSHAWHSFTATRATSNYNPSRLLSADSENRWVWWKEAARAFGDRPAGGWGAGSFGVVHLLYRRDTLSVQQPHSVPLQFLAETGVIGAILGIGGFVLLAQAAGRGVRRRPHGPERTLAAALFGAVIAYAVQSIYDWDWGIPAVSLPAFLVLGALVASRGRSRRARHQLAPAREFRPASLGLLALWLSAFAVSAALPSFAASKASSALVQAASSSPSALRSAQASAALASDLDPLSDAGLRAEAAIALHSREPSRARIYLRQAVAKNPTDVQAWDQLFAVSALLGRRREELQAAGRVVKLDPRGSETQLIVRELLLSAHRRGRARNAATRRRAK